MSKKWIARWVLMVVITASAVVLLHSAYSNYATLAKLSFQIWSPAILVALAPMLIMLVAKGWLHVQLLRHEGLKAEPGLSMMTSYFLSQVARYLPGKVIGIAAQSLHMTGSVTGEAVWRANFTQYVTTHFFAVLFLSVVLMVYVTGNILYLVLLLLVFVATGVFLRSNLCVLIFDGSLRLLKRPSRLTNTASWDIGPLAQVLTLLGLDWVFYFGFWILILTTTLSVYNAILFSSIYAAASFLATLFVVMPSGLLIREAAFIWLGTRFGFGHDHLIVYGILARLLFTLGDILIFGSFWLANSALKRLQHGRTASLLERTGTTRKVRVRH